MVTLKSKCLGRLFVRLILGLDLDMIITEITSNSEVKSSELSSRIKTSSKSKNTKHSLYKTESEEVAFVSADCRKDVPYLVLYEIYVAKDNRGKGVGTELLKYLNELTKSLGYRKSSVYPKPLDNDIPESRLVAWYEKNGFFEKKNGTQKLLKII